MRGRVTSATAVRRVAGSRNEARRARAATIAGPGGRVRERAIWATGARPVVRSTIVGRRAARAGAPKGKAAALPGAVRERSRVWH